MNKATPYSPVYKRLAVAVIFSPAIFQFIDSMIDPSPNGSDYHVGVAAMMVIPGFISVIFFLSALNKLNQIKKLIKEDGNISPVKPSQKF